LNSDLAQAIALGQALGAPPFGAAGEAALGAFGYERSEQSVRVVERLEGGGTGLNLTWETRDGILTASGPRDPATVEGEVVRLAVRIAEVTIEPPVSVLGTVGGPLGGDPSSWGDRLIEDAAIASQDRPHLRLTDRMAKVLENLQEAVSAERRQAVGDEHHRAVHCVQSLAIYALEHGEVAGDPVARRRVVDDLAARTDREVVEAYRARFEPPA
jgi:dGTPase